jgi:hypothetical protein
MQKSLSSMQRPILIVDTGVHVIGIATMDQLRRPLIKFRLPRLQN